MRDELALTPTLRGGDPLCPMGDVALEFPPSIHSSGQVAERVRRRRCLRDPQRHGPAVSSRWSAAIKRGTSLARLRSPRRTAEGAPTRRIEMRFVYGMALAVMAVTALGSMMPAAAQNVLDTPSLTYIDNNRSSITVEVQAGPSGAPAGFVVEWMKKSDWEANGYSWPADEYDPRVVY